MEHLSLIDMDCKDGDVSKILLTFRENGKQCMLDMNTRKITMLSIDYYVKNGN